MSEVLTVPSTDQVTPLPKALVGDWGEDSLREKHEARPCSKGVPGRDRTLGTPDETKTEFSLKEQ